MTSRSLISSGSPFEPIIGFSRAVRVGNHVSVAGSGPLDENGQLAGKGDVAAQTRACIEVARRALERAGASLADVTRTRVMVTDIATWRAAAEVHGEYFKDIRPVATFVAVSAFVDPDWLVEVEVDAHIAEPAA